jgi:hypothetical protein
MMRCVLVEMVDFATRHFVPGDAGSLWRWTMC